MPQDLDQLSPERLQSLFLEFKYQAAIRRLARGITHSYNNIFTGLNGQLTILRQGFISTEEISRRRSELTDNLLQRGVEQTAILFDFARDAEAVVRSHSPQLIASRALDLLNSISRVHQFVLRSTVHQEKILCNLRELVLILFYLGENCVDAMPEGGNIDLLVELGKKNSAKSVVFTFCDRGPGFAEDVLAARFAPFVTTRPGAHRGLGLYAARTLAEKNQGRLTIARSEAGSTEVSALFPFLQEEQQASERAGADIHGERPGDRVGRQCVLIVEDDEALRTFLVCQLQRRGHMVFSVSTCAEALEEYEQLHDIITVVLMDVGLRDNSGFACFREMSEVSPQVKIIFMSGYDKAAPAELAGRQFLQKPFTIHQLEQAIRNLHD
jgi:CheY-like chemotaxis protein